jgi:hypothetical protein
MQPQNTFQTKETTKIKGQQSVEHDITTIKHVIAKWKGKKV